MFAAVFTSLLAISFWLMWGPIAWRAIRTGRLLARGVIYDRVSTPKMFWGGLASMGSIGLMTTGLALWSIARL
jgi:hypothetical protein